MGNWYELNTAEMNAQVSSWLDEMHQEMTNVHAEWIDSIVQMLSSDMKRCGYDVEETEVHTYLVNRINIWRYDNDPQAEIMDEVNFTEYDVVMVPRKMPVMESTEHDASELEGVQLVSTWGLSAAKMRHEVHLYKMQSIADMYIVRTNTPWNCVTEYFNGLSLALKAFRDQKNSLRMLVWGAQ